VSPFRERPDVVLELGELRLPGRVLERNREFVRVVPFVRPLVENATLDGTATTVETPAARGLRRAEGVLQAEGSPADAVFRIDFNGEPDVVQRREFVRVDAVLPATLWLPGAGLPLESFALNVSGAGFLVAGPESLSVGELVRFELRLPPDDTTVGGVARVAREGANGARGLEFTEIPNREREMLVRFTFDRQREQLRAGVRR